MCFTAFRTYEAKLLILQVQNDTYILKCLDVTPAFNEKFPSHISGLVLQLPYLKCSCRNMWRMLRAVEPLWNLWTPMYIRHRQGLDFWVVTELCLALEASLCCFLHNHYSDISLPLIFRFQRRHAEKPQEPHSPLPNNNKKGELESDVERYWQMRLCHRLSV